MFLFILESIGTSELLLVALLALIIFGPRKLPELMRKGGKMMADFRRTTNEFKESWEKEVSLEEFSFEDKPEKNLTASPSENIIGRTGRETADEVITPEIKEINQEDFERAVAARKIEEKEQETPVETESGVGEYGSDLVEKRNWL